MLVDVRLDAPTQRGELRLQILQMALDGIAYFSVGHAQAVVRLPMGFFQGGQAAQQGAQHAHHRRRRLPGRRPEGRPEARQHRRIHRIGLVAPDTVRSGSSQTAADG